MAAELSAPPVLSTPAENTFDLDPSPAAAIERPPRTDEELAEVYEITRTAAEIAEQGWRRIALQFPDAMLGDAPWVVEALKKALADLPVTTTSRRARAPAEALETDVAAKSQSPTDVQAPTPAEQEQGPRLYILADTSYSACCVDEIAAEHADADAVVHYGRSCLSPTSHLPVFYVFTRQKLDYEAVVASFQKEFEDKEAKVVVMADVMFQEHVAPVCQRLRENGYAAVVGTDIVRDPGASIPNRKLVMPDGAATGPDLDLDLTAHHVFHISIPPTSLLLSLSSRLASLRIYPTPDSPYMTSGSIPDPSMTPGLLRRRYGLVIRLATASVIGILVNTLSVRNYLSTITHLKEQIAAAGKKSYTIVVGKLNAAKLANFSEIDGWVVVGCWESGLVEQEDLWKPVITPFELGLAMAGDDKRIWDGSWWGGIEGVAAKTEERDANASETNETDDTEELVEVAAHDDVEGGVSDDETEPPEFDLRTGKLIFNSRPMRMPVRSANSQKATPASEQGGEAPEDKKSSAALVHRKAGELATVNGVVSPGAEYLRSQRTWQGLGSDFNTADEEHEDETSTTVEEGRSGVARGYTVGDDASRA